MIESLELESPSSLNRPGTWLNPGRLFALSCLAMLAALAFTQSASASDEQDPEVAGVIRNDAGQPIANAWVTDGTNYTFTDRDGIFVFDQGKVVPGSSLVVSSSGYVQKSVVAPNNGDHVEVTMNPYAIRGLYFNPRLSNNPTTVANYIQIAKTTEVNAVVIDVKENVIYFDTENKVFQDAGMVLPILDLPWLLNEFRSNGIYTIARIVVFKVSPIAEQYPQHAVTDTATGGLWRDQNGAAWVNPLDRTMWEPNLSLAEEVIALGFDEVQYDYIRFPTDGNMARANFGQPVTAEDRESAIEEFLGQSRERIIPMGGRQSADVFGYTTVVDNDLGIGQNFSEVSKNVDYVSPMIYPSHWPRGSLYGIPGHPNDYPYLTVKISMTSAIDQLDGSPLQIRPWLQDFGMPGMYTYGVPEVQAQIQALNDVGINSWLIWSPSNSFHVGAFKQDVTADMVPTIEPFVRPIPAPQNQSRKRASTT